MAAIALTIIILLNYLAFYYAYGALVGTKKKRFFPAKNPVDARRPGWSRWWVFSVVFSLRKLYTESYVRLC